MCPVARAEGIIDKIIYAFGQVLCKLRVVLFFSVIKPEILEEEDLSFLEVLFELFHSFTDDIWS
jgi:hypothetical protein